MERSRQEYCTELLLHSRDLPDPGIEATESASLTLAGRLFATRRACLWKLQPGIVSHGAHVSFPCMQNMLTPHPRPQSLIPRQRQLKIQSPIFRLGPGVCEAPEVQPLKYDSSWADLCETRDLPSHTQRQMRVRITAPALLTRKGSS